MNADHPYVALLQQYQEDSNRHAIEACVAAFNSDAGIEMNGELYQGVEALRAAHEYDEASHTQVAFSDFVVEGDTVHCTFWNEHELSRVVGTNGTTGKATFTCRDGKIQRFTILPPDEEERRRVMTQAGPAFRWLRENHPDAMAKWNGFDRDAGAALTALAELWREHAREPQTDTQ